MKKIKKVLAMIMAMAMIMGLGMTAFAAPSGKITVAVDDGATVKYAKIVEEDRNSVYGWDFTDAAKKDFVNAWMGRNAETAVTDADRDTVIAALIALGKLEDVNNKFAQAGDVNDKANGDKFATALQAVANLATTEFNASEGIDVTESGNGIGLYLITASKTGYTYIPMAAYVGTTFTGVEVEAKGAKDQIEKTTEDGQSAMTGDIINYTVTVEYPYYPADATSTKFIVSDTLQNATFVADSLKVVDNAGATLAADTDYTVNTYANTNNMVITFKYNNDKAGDVLTITYQAKVGDLTDGAQVSNSAKSDTENGYTIADVISDSAEFKVIKTDDNTEKPVKLAGAVFTLYVEDENGDETLTYNDSEVTVRKVIASEPTDSNGETVFKGLDVDQTYYVKETTAPEGYTVNDTVYRLEGASRDSSVTSNSDTDENGVPYTQITTTWTVKDYNDQTVTDTKISSLPSTGGMGTTIFTIGGVVIMIAAAGLYFANRKKESK